MHTLCLSVVLVSDACCLVLRSCLKVASLCCRGLRGLGFRSSSRCQGLCTTCSISLCLGCSPANIISLHCSMHWCEVHDPCLCCFLMMPPAGLGFALGLSLGLRSFAAAAAAKELAASKIATSSIYLLTSHHMDFHWLVRCFTCACVWGSRWFNFIQVSSSQGRPLVNGPHNPCRGPTGGHVNLGSFCCTLPGIYFWGSLRAQ